MATERRILRLQQLILETVASVLQRELSDPRIGMITVTRVKLSSDLSYAQVGWSCLGSEARQRTVERGLADATPVVQRAVAKALRTRTTPAITFRFDPSLERSQQLETIFEQLRKERGDEGEVAGEGEEIT